MLSAIVKHAARRVGAASAVVLVPAVAGVAWAGRISPDQLCEAAMLSSAAKFAQCRLRAESAFAKTGNASKLATAYAKCSRGLTSAFGSARKRHGGSCPATEPEPEFAAFLTQCSDTTTDAAGGARFPACGDGAINVAGEHCDRADLGGATCASLGFTSGALACTAGCSYDTSGCSWGSPGAGNSLPATGQTTCWDSSGVLLPCAGTGHDGDFRAGVRLAYVDNGDGTVTDLATSLMWEKISDDGTIHDKDRTFSWNDAFAVKIATLNSTSFAGHDDWRLPNVRELQSIVNYQNMNPAVSPVFHTGCVNDCAATGATPCSCTMADNYWSSSTYVNTLHFAWHVLFNVGFVTANNKGFANHVRAVRGGS